MGRKDELKDQARELGLPTDGTIAELEERIAGAGLVEETLVLARYVGPTRNYKIGVSGYRLLKPGDTAMVPESFLDNDHFEPAPEPSEPSAGDEPTTQTEES